MKKISDKIIGVDIGTGGVKAVLFDLHGRSLSTAFRPSELYRPETGTVEEDPEFQVAGVCDAIAECVNRAGCAANDIAAIGIDGQMAGVIGIDENGRCVTPYDSWLDTRCAPYIRKMEERAGTEIMRKTGCAPSFNHGPKILWWQAEHPDTFRRIHAFIQPSGYAVMRLCDLKGEAAFIDPTYLHFSGFADNAASRWDHNLCKDFNIPEGILPQIVSPEALIGELSQEMGIRCGLCAGISVVAGCGDTAASFLACGATSPGICVDVAGTASVFSATTGNFKADITERVLACGQAVTPGLWHSYAYINGGGMNLNWFAGEILGCGDRIADSLNSLEVLAKKITPNNGLPVFVPHLGGRVCPSQPEMCGAWLNLSQKHGTAELYRAILEAVALEYRIYVETIRLLYPDLQLTEVRVTGGGEKSALWNQIKADVLGIPVTRITDGHGAPLGAAMVAACAVGLFGNSSQAAEQWTSLGETFEPDHAKRDYYDNRLRKYRKALKLLKEDL